MNELNQNISHHHGTCDMCNRRNVVILMFGYMTQDTKCYSICKNCFAVHIQQIIYGFHDFSDGMIN